MALPFPSNCKGEIEMAPMQLKYERFNEFLDRSTLDGWKVGCENILTLIKEERFKKMFLEHEITFAFEP